MDQPDLTDSTRLQQLYSNRVAQRGADASAPHVPPEAILAVIQREGPESERMAALEHIMSCAACHREYEWLTAVDQSALEAEGTPARTARRWSWSQVAPLAAAAALLLTVGTAVVVEQRRGPEPERGGGGSDISLVAPVEGATAAGALVFVWHPVAGASRYVLELQRHDGSVAFTDTTSDTTFTLGDPSRVLTDREYRWWVRETTDGAEPRSSSLRELKLSR